jgi:hypothetical protein
LKPDGKNHAVYPYTRGGINSMEEGIEKQLTCSSSSLDAYVDLEQV